jgi:cytochrome d ubiquinol oxidase subunit I
MIFVMVYFLVFGTGIYYMLKLMAKGPNLPQDEADAEAGDTGHGRERFDHRPLSRPTDPIDE